jgi:hypothetical protein
MTRAYGFAKFLIFLHRKRNFLILMTTIFFFLTNSILFLVQISFSKKYCITSSVFYNTNEVQYYVKLRICLNSVASICLTEKICIVKWPDVWNAEKWIHEPASQKQMHTHTAVNSQHKQYKKRKINVPINRHNYRIFHTV